MSETKIGVILHGVLITIGSLIIVLNRKNNLKVDTYPF